MGGGAWPFLVGGAICLVNSDNERDSTLLNSWWIVTRGRLGSSAVYVRVPGIFGRVWLSVRTLARPRRQSWRLGKGGGRADPALSSPGVSARWIPRLYRGVHRNFFLEGSEVSSLTRKSNNRSVMPLDVLGRTRATMEGSACSLLRKEWVTASNPFSMGIGACKCFP